LTGAHLGGVQRADLGGGQPQRLDALGGVAAGQQGGRGVRADPGEQRRGVGEVAPTFLGERYRRIARRRGKKKAVVAVGRSILTIVWRLLSDPDTRFQDLGADFYDTRIKPDRKKRNHVRQLEALGYQVILEPAV
jgi:hypothetical protein